MRLKPVQLTALTITMSVSSRKVLKVRKLRTYCLEKDLFSFLVRVTKFKTVAKEIGGHNELF